MNYQQFLKLEYSWIGMCMEMYFSWGLSTPALSPSCSNRDSGRNPMLILRFYFCMVFRRGTVRGGGLTLWWPDS